MADTPTPPTPPEPPAESTPTRNEIDKQILADIKLGEDVLETATSDPGHTGALNAEELDADAIPHLTAYTTDARALAARVVPAKNICKAATVAEKVAWSRIMACLRDIQKRAKRKHARDKAQQATYLIGKKNFGANRSILEEDAETILTEAEAGGLPGFTPAKLTAGRMALTQWKQADAAQVTAAESQGKLLAELAAKVAQLNEARREIQRTADLAWPHTDPANAPIRRSFKLPPNKPFGV